MITRKQLINALGRRTVSDWVVLERVEEIAGFDDVRGVHRAGTRPRWTIHVHHDVAHGRGSARLDIGGSEGSATDVVTQALAIAEAAIGPAWQTPPPAAPAKVAVMDPVLAKADLDAVATHLVSSARRPEGATVEIAVEVRREQASVQARSGFHTEWASSLVRASSLVAVGEHSTEIAREARRIADLDLDRAHAAAVTDLRLIATATPPVAGHVAVILGPEALLHGGGLGVWSVFAEHADADVARKGLVRYRAGAAISAGADQLAEPLTITSDGALDWGTASAPVGDEGDAVRRFTIVERGVAAELGMSMREAARQRTDPNGGVRNLVVAPGTWTDALPAGRTIEIRRLRALAIDPYTSTATLDLALSIDRSTKTPFTGGTIRLDLVAALARARRSAATLRRGSYAGPAAVVLEDVELLA